MHNHLCPISTPNHVFSTYINAAAMLLSPAHFDVCQCIVGLCQLCFKHSLKVKLVALVVVMVLHATPRFWLHLKASGITVNTLDHQPDFPSVDPTPPHAHNQDNPSEASYTCCLNRPLKYSQLYTQLILQTAHSRYFGTEGTVPAATQVPNTIHCVSVQACDEGILPNPM